MIHIVDGVLVFDEIIVLFVSAVMLSAVFFDPYLSFLIAIACALSFGNQTLLQSKIGFWTFIDTSLFVSILALIKHQFFSKRKSKLLLPFPAVACIIILVTGFSISLFRYDDLYISFRALRWAIGLPIYFIISANIVNTQEKVKSLFFVLLIAAILASIQHLIWLFYTKTVFYIESSPDIFRNIGFFRNQEVFLVVGPFCLKNKIPHPFIQVSIAVLFLLTFLSQQTRSAFLGTLLAFFVYSVFFLKKRISLKKIFSISLILILTLLLLVSALNVSGFSSLSNNYVKRLSGTLDNNKSEKLDDTLTRKNAIEKESQDWISGNMIFGEGLFYYQRYGYGFKDKTVTDVVSTAYGHIGYIAYLSQLGVIGFIIYALLLPISVLLKTKKVLDSIHITPELKYIASLTAINFLSVLLFTGSFLVSYITIPGILAGVVWRFSTLKPSKKLML